MERRQYIKAVGGIGTAASIGIGSIALSGGASASAINISASNASVSNDRGDVSSVTVDPDFSIEWSGLDDAVGKVFWLLEASVDGGDYHPIYRATPWLSEDSIGTSGSLNLSTFSDRLGRSLVVADSDGVPDYSTIVQDGPATESSYLDGTSMGSADNYTGSYTLQNNFPDEDAGYYGAASDDTPFDNGNNGGDTKSTPVDLRYTIELQRPNLNQLSYDNKADAAANIDGLKESDIDTDNSTIVMNGEDGEPEFATPAAIPYDTLQTKGENHVGVIVANASFTIDVDNIGSDNGTTGSSGTNAN